MEQIRNHTPTQLGAIKVEEFRDYKTSVVKNMEQGTEGETGLPKSNVLYFKLEKDAWCCVRPSGTEPKIKFYIGVKGESMEQATALIEAIKEAITALTA